ncbi:AAA domain-containing protein [Nocardia sp. NPDC058640]|uniref:AAA domain-containing protein n=1 Tax=Nocardia sp. NPDC058640 TaxID=3346571 RepID=UPI0036684D06
MRVVSDAENTDADLVDRAARLFRFLARVQALGVHQVQHTDDLGLVQWLGDLPNGTDIRLDSISADSAFLCLHKVVRTPSVEPPAVVRDWLTSPRWHDPGVEPALRPGLPGDGSEISASFAQWLPQWRAWSAAAAREESAQRVYQNLYQMYSDVHAAAESKEAVLGLGCLAWRRPSFGTARRHVLTVPIKIDFDTDSGVLAVCLDVDAGRIAVELADFLDPAEIVDPSLLSTIERELASGTASLDRVAVAVSMRKLLHSLGPLAGYRDEDVAGTATAEPVGYFAPALILRSRGKRSMTRVLDSIADRIRGSRTVPSGLLNLVDPAYEPKPEPVHDDGAIVRDGTDCFLPLPLNGVQLDILAHVDEYAHTIVQGPPGTGKTHTAAALITHLLAQGKRVLVTAHTDRALEEVRGKLRPEMRGLCVSVAGASRDDFDDLKRSMERIARESDNHNPVKATQTIAAVHTRVDALISARASVQDQLLALREREVQRHEFDCYCGTLTELTTAYRADADRFGWIEGIDPAELSEVTADEVEAWRELLTDPALADPDVGVPDSITTREVPPVAQFAQWAQHLAAADAAVRGLVGEGSQPWIGAIETMPANLRADTQALVRRVELELGELSGSRDRWIRDAAADISGGRAGTWHDRAQLLGELLPRADTLLAQLGIVQVRVTGEHSVMATLAESLLALIQATGPIPVRADGSPKVGIGTNRIVKQALPLFESVRVDGRIPTTAEQLTTFLRTEELSRLLMHLDEVWTGSAAGRSAGGSAIRLAWHREHFHQLRRVLSCGADLVRVGRQLRMAGIAEPDWAHPGARRALAASFDAADAIDQWSVAKRPLDALAAKLARLRFPRHTSREVDELYAAVEHVDVDAYRRAHRRLAELNALRTKFFCRQQLDSTMTRTPMLRAAVLASADDPRWSTRMAELSAARAWAQLGVWLAERGDADVNELFGRLDDIEQALRDASAELAVTKSWNHAVGPDRLTPATRTDLRQYAQLVRRLGKGTGVHGDRRRADIRATMARCRSAVPVWIMPMYRVVEQLDIEQDMFDVVVVDEASQAGAEAVFLQYLAPRIVVIGDERQVSPSGVGIKVDAVTGLAEQYIADDRYRASWVDPKRSLFDEAAMRFPSRLRLVEHRRCVPEIIGFSNRIAYQKDAVPLVPVRLYGTDRLVPIRAEYMPNAISTPSNTNDAEAERIVARIVECLADPRYAGKTFGVISLLGAAQGELIWTKLMLAVAPEEIARRRLRCGDAADFQGAERDVIFLSMVKAPGPDTRLVARVDEASIQRYNVAVSRAADQLWLFHSISLDQLHNPADLRYQLLDYCLSSVMAQPESVITAPAAAPEDHLVAPFNSLFQQQVFNRIVARGFRVSPQYSVGSRTLDLVVIGGHIRVAVECEGDQWEGADAYRATLTWQRDLQRCGWPFFRLPQSRFVVDPERSLEPLWALFRQVGLTPARDEEPVIAQEVVAPAEAAPVADSDAVSARVLADFDWSKPDQERIADEEIGEYQAFSGLVAVPSAGMDTAVVDDLIRIVTTEGPVTAARIHSVFARTAGGTDVGPTVDAALATAVEQGQLLAEDYLNMSRPEWISYRKPEQSTVCLRTIGVRRIEEVPARELAGMLRHCADTVGWGDRRELMRSALGAFGQAQLTDRAIAMLALALPAAHGATER